MKNKTDQELVTIANDRVFYPAEKRLAALLELESRGALSPELQSMKESIQFGYANTEENDRYNLFKKNDNITDDPTAPQLYSHKILYLFSVLFSVFFGSILLSLNLTRVEKKKEGFIAVLIGLSVTMLISLAARRIPNGSSIVLALNVVCSILMIEFFWKKYIGKDLKYRRRSIVIPLVIGLIFTGLVIISIFLVP